MVIIGLFAGGRRLQKKQPSAEFFINLFGSNQFQAKHLGTCLSFGGRFEIKLLANQNVVRLVAFSGRMQPINRSSICCGIAMAISSVSVPMLFTFYCYDGFSLSQLQVLLVQLWL